MKQTNKQTKSEWKTEPKQKGGYHNKSTLLARRVIASEKSKKKISRDFEVESR